DLNAFPSRYPGSISERLLDVWLLTNNYAYAELPVVSTEPVNWWKKGTSFIRAKLGGKGYDASF
ncbi:MAG: glycosyl transferase, partial [Bifidobacterium sp.]